VVEGLLKRQRFGDSQMIRLPDYPELGPRNATRTPPVTDQQDRAALASARTRLLAADVRLRRELADDADHATWSARYEEGMQASQTEAGALIRSPQDRARFEDTAKLDLQRAAAELARSARQLRFNEDLATLRETALAAGDEATRVAAIDTAGEIFAAALANGDLTSEDADRARQDWVRRYSVGRIELARLANEVAATSEQPNPVEDGDSLLADNALPDAETDGHTSGAESAKANKSAANRQISARHEAIHESNLDQPDDLVGGSQSQEKLTVHDATSSDDPVVEGDLDIHRAAPPSDPDALHFGRVPEWIEDIFNPDGIPPKVRHDREKLPGRQQLKRNDDGTWELKYEITGKTGVTRQGESNEESYRIRYYDKNGILIREAVVELLPPAQPLSTSAPSSGFPRNGGINISPSLEPVIQKVYDDTMAKTGRGFKVTSGSRGPERQAKAMYDNYAAKKRDRYRNRQAAAQVRAAYDLGVSEGETPGQIVLRMQRVLEDQVRRGTYVSLHMRSGAMDIRGDTSPEVIGFLRKHPSVSTVLGEGNHWHIQFRQ
jgi:hypothetical protein